MRKKDADEDAAECVRPEKTPLRNFGGCFYVLTDQKESEGISVKRDQPKDPSKLPELHWTTHTTRRSQNCAQKHKKTANDMRIRKSRTMM